MWATNFLKKAKHRFSSKNNNSYRKKNHNNNRNKFNSSQKQQQQQSINTASGGGGGSKQKLNWRWAFLILPATCVGLGVWQLQRLQWKLGLIAERERGLNQPPIKFPGAEIAERDVEELAFRPMMVTGKYVHSEEILVGPRVYNGDPGFHLITPFITKEGEKILINRGFIYNSYADKSSRAYSLTEGSIDLIGILRKYQSKGAWVADNDPEKNKWYWVDIYAMADKTKSEPVMLDLTGINTIPSASSSSPNSTLPGFPIPGQTITALNNPHLGYAATWFSLSILLSIMTVVLVRQSNKQAQFALKYGRPPTTTANINNPFHHNKKNNY